MAREKKVFHWDQNVGTMRGEGENRCATETKRKKSSDATAKIAKRGESRSKKGDPLSIKKASLGFLNRKR